MTAIVHRCIACGHIDQAHRSTDCSHGGCSYGKHTPEYGQPELIPTFDASGAVVESIKVPGSRSNGWWQMCDCADCVVLYDSTVSVGTR